MIYLVTGVLGTGKTAMVVNMILDNYENLFRIQTDDGNEIQRPLYFCHVDGLDKKKLKAHELTEEQIQEKPLKDIIPNGSVLIVDEADYTYPVRSATREVPPYIKTLKEIRHEGITLILMTQHPSMIDKYIRQLVGKHIHLERKQVGTKRYEWLRCEENLNSQSFAQAQSQFYKPDKKAFAYYKSASIHVDFKKKRHWAFYALPVVILVGVVGFMYARKLVITDRQKPNETTVSAASVPAAPSLPEITDMPQITPRSASVPLGSQLNDYVPAVRNLPETKPIYDNVRQVVNMETVSACVKSGKSCNCYTNQGTKLYIDKMVCEAYIRDGIFDRYSDISGRRS